MSDSTSPESWSSAATDQPASAPSPAFRDRVVKVWHAAVGGVVALVIGLGVGIGVDHALFESSASAQPPASQLGQLGQSGQLGQAGQMPGGTSGMPPGQGTSQVQGQAGLSS